MTPPESSHGRSAGRDFIRQIILKDLDAGMHPEGVVTRFPPEPNGFLHIGHAKSIVLNFGIAAEFGAAGGRLPGRARCHLRFDDTNPTTEDIRYVEAIQEDVRWLGYDWGEHLYFASDEFEAMYGFAQELIRKGLAYVDSQSDEAIREGRGTVTMAGVPSPFRDRSVEENLDLFTRMRAGEFENGSHVLRARIDLASPNMLMRDPVLFRIRHAEHYRTGDAWCIYPLYDFAHPLEDALEGVTHSLCTLEFENNRELYDWVIEHTSVPYRPRQYEFARLNLDYAVMSKRKLLRLVREGDVSGWDDPRMLTLAGLRRRGFTPDSIRSFCEMIGVARSDSRVDMGKLEYSIRDDLNGKAPRVLCVLHPLKVILENWPEGEREVLDAPYFPHDVPLEGSRAVPLTRELFIDREDFSENPPPGFRRLVPGGEVRLRHAGVIRCEQVIKDASGAVVELRCTLLPEGVEDDHGTEARPRGTIHWVSASESLACEVRLYDRLFTVSDPDSASAEGEEASADDAFRSFLNPHSLTVVEGARVEPSVLEDASETRYQFERVGYFWRDPVDSLPGRLVFNRIVTLRDSWARALQRGEGDSQASTPPRVERVHASEPGDRPPVPPEVQARAERLEIELGLGAVEAEILARDPRTEAYFRAAWVAGGGPASGGVPRALTLANWMIHELPAVQEGRSLEELPLMPASLAELVDLVEDGTLSSTGAKQILGVLARDGGRPQELVERMGLTQIRDEAVLQEAALRILSANPEKVTAYRAGKVGLMGFFVGQVMRETAGRADPERVTEILRGHLEGASPGSS
jgi:glutaminyl-tRNA synthetase